MIRSKTRIVPKVGFAELERVFDEGRNGVPSKDTEIILVWPSGGELAAEVVTVTRDGADRLIAILLKCEASGGRPRFVKFARFRAADELRCVSEDVVDQYDHTYADTNHFPLKWPEPLVDPED